MMKKILIIITTEFSNYSGIASVVMNYVRFMDMNDMQIDILSRNEPEAELIDELRKKNIHYYKIPYRNSNPLRYMLELQHIAKNYDVMHVNANSATASVELLAGRLAGVKTRIAHNHNSTCEHQVIHRLLLPLFKSLYTQAVACSKKAGDWIFGANNYVILNNGMDIERYQFSEKSRHKIRGLYNISENMVVIGHVSKMYKSKNYQFLVALFEQYYANHPDSILFLVGDGEIKKEIEEDVTNRGLNECVIFAGMQKNTQEYLSAMDVFVFPSLWEGLPLAMIEAQASGIYCLASDCIDSEVNVSGEVYMLPINQGVQPWINQLEQRDSYDRNKVSKKRIKKMQEANYDIKANAKELKTLYFVDK